MATKNSQPVSVVTGGAGFLGSHLVDRLLTEGHRVIAIDNLITGNTANIGHLAGNKDFHFIKHNVSNFIFLPDEKIDYVFHFASPASPIDYLELPIPTLKVGALGTHNTLGLAKDKKATFVLASTSECYGDPLVQYAATKAPLRIHELFARHAAGSAKAGVVFFVDMSSFIQVKCATSRRLPVVIAGGLAWI